MQRIRIFRRPSSESDHGATRLEVRENPASGAGSPLGGAKLASSLTLLLIATFFAPGPAASTDCCPTGVPDCCERHDNRPAVCDGVASKCEKLSNGSCKYTHPDGTTKTYNWNDCCCVQSRDCPEATYVARCLRSSAYQSWHDDGPNSSVLSYEIVFSQPFSQYQVIDNSTGCVTTTSSIPPIVTDHEGHADATVDMMATSTGQGTVALTTYDSQGSFVLTMEKCFECSSPQQAPTELSCSP